MMAANIEGLRVFHSETGDAGQAEYGTVFSGRIRGGFFCP
jgi:hypothetical protein